VFTIAPDGSDEEVVEERGRSSDQGNALEPGGMTMGRRAWIRFSAVLLVTAAVVSACDRTEVNRSPAEIFHLKRELQILAPYPGVAAVRTDAGIQRAAIGEGESGRPADPQDVFDIGSITKTFEATVILQLVGEGRLSLEDPVGSLLPGARLRDELPDTELEEARRITVRQLLNHSSGLSDRDPSALAFPPGTRFMYANRNYDVLGAILEEVTRRPIRREVADRIFHPLDLKSPAIGSSDEVHWLGGPLPPAERGGFALTVDDLATFFAALLGGQLLPPDLLTEMTDTIAVHEGQRAGLGIFEWELSCGTAWGHGGEVSHSSMTLAARDGSKVVVVAQRDDDAVGWVTAKLVAEDIYCS
jgi:D-alanyl-D-alanine carboxypeptidase